MRLADKVAIITGAGRGIGRAIALAYAREGARLALVARSPNELEDTAREAQALGVPACVIPTDVADREQVDSMVAQVIDQYSTIDILVNNAAISGPVGPLWDNEPEHWVQTIQVNLFGTFFCCRAVLPVMVKQDRGQLINIGGGGDMESSPNFSAYSSSKAAMVRLTEVLALELAETNVRVNSLRPGSVHTRMMEEEVEVLDALGINELRDQVKVTTGGGGEPIEITANLAVVLASADAGNLSGRLVATRDDITKWTGRIPEIMESEAYLLRRVEHP